MLTAHFLVPAGVPKDSAAVAQLAAFTRGHHDSLLVSAWLQVAGATLYVLFVLAVVHLAGAMGRFAATITLLAGTTLVMLALVDSALIMAAVQAAAAGHTQTLRVSFDLVAGPGNDAIGRSFLLAPAILIPFGIVLVQTRFVPRAFGYAAVGLGVASQALGLIGLFSQLAFADINPAVLGLENLWLVAVAIAVARTAHRPRMPRRAHATSGAS
jgi:hypothetical protein